MESPQVAVGATWVGHPDQVGVEVVVAHNLVVEVVEEAEEAHPYRVEVAEVVVHLQGGAVVVEVVGHHQILVVVEAVVARHHRPLQVFHWLLPQYLQLSGTHQMKRVESVIIQ